MDGGFQMFGMGQGGEEMGEILQRVFEEIMSGRGRGPRSDDPSKYPLAVQIRSDWVIMAYARIKEKALQMKRLQQDMGILSNEMQADRGKMYRELERTYPEVRTPDSAGVRILSWKGELYYASFNKEEDEAKPEHPENDL